MVREVATAVLLPPDLELPLIQSEDLLECDPEKLRDPKSKTPARNAGRQFPEPVSPSPLSSDTADCTFRKCAAGHAPKSSSP